MNHIGILELRLSNERLRLSRATSQNERAIRQVYVDQMTREADAERQFLQMDMTDDELMKELTK
jgi:hypothetical protein